MAKIRSAFHPSARHPMSLPVRRGGPTPSARHREAGPSPFSPPIALFGQVDVLPGSEQEVSTGSISNNMGRPIEVREIRFVASIASSGANQFLNPAAVLSATITVNGKPLMAVPTPIWSLCRLDRAGNQIVADARLGTTYVMRLSRPMILPSKAEVRCRFSHNGVVPFTVTGGACLAGTFTDKREPTTAVPYALFWESTQRLATDVLSETSPEKNLTNSLKTSFHVDRIICRHVTLGSGAANTSLTDPAIFLSDGRGGGGDFGFVAPIEQMLSIKLATSRNQQIIPFAVPIWHAFQTSGAIEIPHVMAPSDFYRATIASALPVDSFVPALLAQIPTFRHNAHLSMIGWREEAL